MRAIVTILTILIFELANGQDCRFDFKDYHQNIDTTKRPVYFTVDSMPDLMSTGKLLRFMTEKIHSIDNNCCPIYVWYGFVIEPDSTLSNIATCPQFYFCNDSIDLVLETEYFNKKLKDKLMNCKVKPGLQNGKRVAVSTVGRIHFECR